MSILSRSLALVATLWTVVYIGGYVVLVTHQGNGPAWWYLGLITISLVPLIVALAGRPHRAVLVASVVGLGLSTVVGILSIGILLLPAVICALIAVTTMKPAPPDPQPRAVA